MQIKLSEIKVASRIREDMGDLSGLIKSIQKIGPIQPLIVDSDMNLLAGERRYRALEKLNFQTVEVCVKSHLTPVDCLMIEVEENLNRKDFTDSEKVKGLLQLHRAKIAEDPKRAWTLQNTADLLSYSKGTISIMLKVAEVQEKQEVLPEDEQNKKFMEALESEGAFAAYKELASQEADEVLKKLSDAQKRGDSAVDQTALSLIDSSLVHADCLDFIKEIPDGTIHFVLTDPPYGIDAQEIMEYKGDDSPEYAIDIMTKLAPELYRVCAKDSSMMIFFGIKNMPQLVAVMESVGFQSSPTPFIWVKDIIQGRNNQPNKWLTSAFEFAWMFVKGDPILSLPGSLGYFIDKPPATEIKIHANQKPIRLISYLIDVIAIPNSNLLDPFAGSGAILATGMAKGLNVCGCEKNEEYYTKARMGLLEQQSGLSIVDATMKKFGFSDKQIELATEESKERIVKENLLPTQIAILTNGEIFMVDKAFGSLPKETQPVL